MLRERFEARLAESVERIWDLPPIILKESTGDYVILLLEARELFVADYFYSCVAILLPFRSLRPSRAQA